MKSESVRSALIELIRIRAGTEVATWLENSVADARQNLDRVCVDLTRQTGKKPLIAGFKERTHSVLMTGLGAMPIGHWRLDRAARSWLLATLSAASDKPFARLFELYDKGDTETRLAALLAVNLVDDADTAQGLALIHDAGRSQSREDPSRSES